MMKWMLAVLALTLALNVRAAAENGLLLHCAFDGTVEPTVAAGAKTFRTNNTPEFQEGVNGQAILIGGQTPEGKTRFVTYAPSNNLNPEAGTVSLWVKPVDWDGDDAHFIILFHAAMGDAEMLIYKFHGGDAFQFFIGPVGGWDRLLKGIAHWKKGQWHHAAGTWTANEFQFFIDGRLIGTKKRANRPVPLLPVKSISVGLEQVNNPGDLKRSSLVDELRIYGRVLSVAEIQGLYLQYAEAAKAREVRNNIILGEKTAVTDGRVTPGEYAFTGSGFVDMEGFVSRRQGQYALSYDRTNLYVAVQSEAPANAAPQPDNSVTSDRVELYLSPDPVSGAWRRFAFAPDHVVRTGAFGTNTWDCAGLKTAGSVTNGVWTIEAAIPFASLGLAAAPDGQSWRLNLGRVFATPPGAISAFPVVAQLDDLTGFGEVRFNSHAPFIQVADLFDASVTGRISAVSADGQRVEGALSSWSSVTDYSQRIINFKLQDGTNQTPFKASGRNSFPTLYGDITLDIFDGKSKATLFRGVYNTRSVVPLFGYFAYAIPEKNQLMAGLRCQGGKKIRLRFLGAGKTGAEQYTQPDKGYPRFPVCTNIVYEQVKEMPQGALHFNLPFDVDFAAIGPGDYMVNIDALDEAGKVLGSFDRKFNIPGKDSPVTRPFKPDNERVPYPWSPIKAGNVAAEIWGRKYDFSGGVLFSSLISQDKELLAAPAYLRLNGQELSVMGAALPRKVSGDDWSAVWEKDADLGQLKTSSRIKTHFDGYCEVELTLQPAAAAADIKTLSLDIPVKSAFATLVTDGRVPPYTKTGALSNGWFQTGQQQLWVGNEEIGFNWTAETLEGWSLKPDSKNIEVLRQAEKSIIRFNLVDVPLDLKEPRTIRFGFVVTPSRPLEPGMRRIRWWREGRVVAQGGADYFASYIYNDEPWEYEAGAFTDAMLYSTWSFYSPFAPEYGYWETQWSRPPFGVYSGVMPPSVEGRERCLYAVAGGKLFTNFILNQFQDYIKNHYPPYKSVKHFAFDVGGSVGERYQALTMCKMIKEKNPGAKVFFHTGYGRQMAGQHFADASVAGEGFELNVAKQLNYYDLLTPEFFRAVYLKEIWGLRGVIICQLTRGLQLFNPAAYVKYDINDPVHKNAMLHFMGYMMTHDVDANWENNKKMMPMVNRLYDAQDKLGWDDQVVFHPYWKPDSGVRQVAPGLSRVMASAYTRNGKMLLAVLNDTDKENTVTLELDLAKLGVKAGLKGHDVWQSEAPYTLADTWEARVPPRAFRLILWGAE